MLPNFLVIGAMRAGTTTLSAHLRAHPEVFVPQLKEPQFFTVEKNWHRGRDWYESLFEEAGSARARGELSTTYTHARWFRGVSDRIAAMLPDAKLIYLIRQPVDRLLSEYHHQATRWPGTPPIEEALMDEDRLLSRSMYAFQLQQYLRHYDRERILVITTEDLASEPQSTMRRVFAFLDVDPDQTVAEALVLNAAGEQRREPRLVQRARSSRVTRVMLDRVPGPVRAAAWRALSRSVGVARYPTVSDEVLRHVRQRLTPDLVELRDLLGGDFHCWGMLDD